MDKPKSYLRKWEIEVNEGVDRWNHPCVRVTLVEYRMLPVDDGGPAPVVHKFYQSQEVYMPNALLRFFGDTLEKRIERTIRRIKKRIAQFERDQDEIRRVVLLYENK